MTDAVTDASTDASTDATAAIAQGEIDRIVTTSADLVAAQYVFPETGTELADLLRANLREGRYAGAGVAEVSALSALVTADLQSANGDRHLRLKHHDEELPDLPSEALTIAIFTEQSVHNLGGVGAVERLTGPNGTTVARLELGPVLYPPSMAADVVAGAMQVVAGADALILDLRGTLGGDPQMTAFVCSYLFDEPTHLIDIYQREGDRTTQSWTLPYVPGRRFGGTKPLFVLTSGTTFSGGEELAFDLQRKGRATVVGEPTRGGAHPRVGHRLHPHLELTIPTGRALDPVAGDNWEGVGVRPDVETPAAQALEVALARVP